MAYSCVLDYIDGKYIFPESAGTVSKSVQFKIGYKASQMFRDFYERFYNIYQNTEKVSKIFTTKIEKYL